MYKLIITILATQKNSMSAPVTSTFVGKNFSRSFVLSGHPIVEKGHKADENHVSSTSVSSLKGTSFPNFSLA